MRQTHMKFIHDMEHKNTTAKISD